MQNRIIPLIVFIIILILLKINAQTTTDSIMSQINIDLITNYEEPAESILTSE